MERVLVVLLALVFQMGCISTKDTNLSLPSPTSTPVETPTPTASISPVLEEPIKPTFKSIQKKIFLKTCSPCHFGNFPKGDVSLNSLPELLQSKRQPLIMEDPGDPDTSGMMLVLMSEKDSKRMPPPPRTILSVEELDVIREWIKAEAPLE
ncbi:hypothetical protein HZA26_04340 [Candidatus Nomurabacteria bacterium]|nr:hypothetical protein [Candidatus Nomurabacteria bacterium]